MPVVTKSLVIHTKENYHMVDITQQVVEKVANSNVDHGAVNLFVPGATAALTTIEYEPGLVQDMEEFFSRIIPQNKRYHHNDRWHDGNGHSHLRASLLGPSLTVPFIESRLTLGTWQQIVLIDFDVPARQRKIILQIIGETNS